MFRIFFIIFFAINCFSLSEKEIETIDFTGEIDLVLGDFSKSNLEKVCDISYPSFYKIWKEKPKFSKEDIAICENLLNDYFKSFGFYKAKINSEIKDNKAIFDIKRNEEIKISSIKIDDEYKNIIELKEQEQFKSQNFTNSKRNLIKYLNQNSYAKADIDAKAYVDLDLYKVDIEYKVIKNNPQYFGDISIENSANINKEFLEKNIVFKKGDRYSTNLIDKTYENLYNFGVYKSISIEEDMERSDDTIPINLKLVQGDYREITYGLGYDTDTKFRAKAQYKNENFLGNLKQLVVGAKANSEGYELYNNFYNPYFIDDDISFSNDIAYSNKNYKSYSEKKIEERLTFSKKFWEIEHNAGVLLEHSTIKSDLDLYKSGSYLLNSLFYEAIFDKRDDILNPKNGYFLSFYIENGTKLILSEIDYIKIKTEFRYIKTVDRFTSSFKTTFGTINKDLPIFKHFFAGGDYSNRGYSLDEVGEKDSNNKPYGGLSMIDSSLEFEYAINKDLGIVTFFDSTMLSLKENKFNDKFYNSFGFGARYYTPIGPLRVDFGFPINDGGFVFHIGIGQVF